MFLCCSSIYIRTHRKSKTHNVRKKKKTKQTKDVNSLDRGMSAQTHPNNDKCNGKPSCHASKEAISNLVALHVLQNKPALCTEPALGW